MEIEEPSTRGPGWSVRPAGTQGADDPGPERPAAGGALDQEPPPPAPWAPPPPPRSAGLSLVAVAPVLLLVGGGLAAVLLVRHDQASSLTTPDVIEGEHRLTGGAVDGMVSSMQDLLKSADPHIQSVVFAAYGSNAGLPSHMLFAESGVTQDPTTGLQELTGASLPSFGGVSMAVGPATVVTVDQESFTCFDTSAQGLPVSLTVSLCFWSDNHPANAGGVLCLGGSADPRECADYTAVARRSVLPG